MSKGRRRKGRKDPSAEEVVFGIIAFTMIYLVSTGISVNTIAGFIFKSLILISIVSIAIWLVRGMMEPEKPIRLKLDRAKSKHSKTAHKTARAAGVPARNNTSGEKQLLPSEWSAKLIAQLEWRAFEKCCIRLWEEKGFSAKETGSGADGGVDFYLYANTTKQKIGAVQCKSWSKRQIDVKVVRELQGVVASQELKLGLLMYSGELSKAAKDFVANPAVSVKVQGNEDILEQIQKLDAKKQTQLLNEMFTEDHQVPSCPNCDVKLVKRTAKKTGNAF